MTDTPLERYLQLLVGPEPGERLLDIRHRRAVGMGQRFIKASRAGDAARVIDSLAGHSDTYVGVLLRDRRFGGKSAISTGRLAFVELDAPDALQRLRRAPVVPSMLVSSGTRGHLHAYWLLDCDLGVCEIERVNRMLAARVGGDSASVDAARLLRPPGSLNHKHDPPELVRLRVLDESRVYSPAKLVAGLTDPQVGRYRERQRDAARRPARLRGRGLLDDGTVELDARLREIETSDYVLLLAGREPDAEGKISCPFHDDRTPSLQCYPGGTWHCFGCKRGGSIYDFAAELWQQQTRGREFLQLRARLAAELGVRAETPTAAARVRSSRTAAPRHRPARRGEGQERVEGERGR
jgi:hypothetical protein